LFYPAAANYCTVCSELPADRADVLRIKGSDIAPRRAAILHKLSTRAAF